MHSETERTRLLFFLMAEIWFSSSSLSLSFIAKGVGDLAVLASVLIEIEGCDVEVALLTLSASFSDTVEFVLGI